MTTYNITSVKHSEEFTGTIDAAIERAIEIYNEYQPAYGVQIENESEETQWDSEDQPHLLIMDIDQQVYSGLLASFDAPNDFLAQLVEEAKQNGGRAQKQDAEGCLVTVNISNMDGAE